jgi:sterol desaturase/sphingolipid hydroxylase (fatty acid hydroxylase superfamily)
MTILSFEPDIVWHHLVETAERHLSGPEVAAVALFWVTIVLAAVVTYMNATRNRRSVRDFLAFAVPGFVVRHRSARADFLFWLSRHAFVPLLVVPLTISTAAAGHVAYWLLSQVFGHPVHPPGHAGTLTLIAFTITMLLAYDLSYYIYHRLQHTVPILWELHKVHHSAEVMVGVTKDRIHPFDSIMNIWWDGLIPGTVYGIWLFFVLNPVEVTVFGISVYVLRNSLLMMDVVRHTHLKLSYGRWLNHLFLCPHYHQLHHSVDQKHWDKNFGLTLTIWDRMFGTLVVPDPGEDFKFGLMANEHDEYQSLYALHVLPVKKIVALLRHQRLRRKPSSISNAGEIA